MQIMETTHLNITNVYTFILVGNSTTLKEKNVSIKEVIESINRFQHNWVMCADVKIVTFLLAKKSRYTKFLSFCPPLQR